MRFTNKYLIIIYRLVLLTICGYGLFLNLGMDTGNVQTFMLLYFTVQINLICFMYMAVCLIKNLMDFKRWDREKPFVIIPRAKGAITISLTITFLIYHFVLLPWIKGSYEDFHFRAIDVIPHYIVPLMMVLDWILWDKKSLFKNTEPIRWILLPYAYLIFTLTRGYFGRPIEHWTSNYPYFFLDAAEVGVGGVMMYVVIITIFTVILGYILYVSDKLLSRVNLRNLRLNNTIVREYNPIEV